MDKFSIFCTPEQTRKALELGAPIEPTFCEHGSVEQALLENPNIPYIKSYYDIPTAEQMLGWLEEHGIIIIFMATAKDDESGYTWIAHACHFQFESVWIDDKNLSRKEATLASIDAALNYLLNQSDYE